MQFRKKLPRNGVIETWASANRASEAVSWQVNPSTISLTQGEHCLYFDQVFWRLTCSVLLYTEAAPQKGLGRFGHALPIHF